MPTDESLLAEVPFFKLLDDEERKALAEVLEEASFGAGEVLFKFGAPGDALYLIRKGRVELSVQDTTGAKVVLAVAEPGDFFGELSLLDGGPRTADAVALEHVELLVLDRDDLLLFFRSEPTAALDMLTEMGQRVRHSGELVRRRVARNANEEIEDKRTVVEKAADSGLRAKAKKALEKIKP